MGRSFFHNRKIRTQMMIGYLLACVIPLLAASNAIYQVAAGNLEESAYELASVFNSQMVKNLDDFIEDYDQLTKLTVVDADVLYGFVGDSVVERMHHQLEIRKILSRLMVLKPEISSILYLDKDGIPYFLGNDWWDIDRQKLLEQPWLKRIQEGNDVLSVSAVHDRAYLNVEDGGLVITVARKLFTYGGTYGGLLLIDMEPSDLIELSDVFLLTRNNYNIKVSVTDAYGEILYDSDVSSGRNTWEEARGFYDTVLQDKDRRDYLVMTSRTRRGGLSVNTVILRSGLLFKINRISYVTAGITILCVTIAILFSAFFSRTITRPIGEVQKHMKKAENGEYEILTQKLSNNEIDGLISSFNHMVVRIKELIEDVYLAEIHEKDAKYLALRTQINPHMLYNTLESIRMKALISGADEVADMIKILAKMFRTALEEERDSHTVRDEVEYVENYLRLQNLRFPNMVSLRVEMEDGVEERPMISLVLQPIIENSISHGFRGRGVLLHITILGKWDGEGNVILKVLDDGRGMSEERNEEINQALGQIGQAIPRGESVESQRSTSIGLSNIAERLRIHYGSGYGLSIRGTEGKGTEVELRIPGDGGLS